MFLQLNVEAHRSEEIHPGDESEEWLLPNGQVDLTKDISKKAPKAFVTCSIANAMVSSYM